MDEKRTVLDTKDKFSLIEEDESRDDDDDDEFELMDKVEKKLNLKKHLSEDQDEDIINLDDLNLNEEDNNINTVCNVINSDEIRENENTAPKSTPFREDIPHGTSPVAEEIQHGSSPIEEDIQQRTSPIILTNNEINIVMEKSDSDEMNLNDLDLKIVPKETAIELLLNKNLETRQEESNKGIFSLLLILFSVVFLILFSYLYSLIFHSFFLLSSFTMHICTHNHMF